VTQEWKEKVLKALEGKPPELQSKMLKAAKRLLIMRAVEAEVTSWTGEGDIPLSAGLTAWMDKLAPESRQAIVRIATRAAWLRAKGVRRGPLPQVPHKESFGH
jgi:sugar/nucleoside kinase (ribokinase family)